MHTIKVIGKALLYAVYGYFSGVYTPVFLTMAFNYMKGPVNNPEGEMFVPLGIMILLAMTAADVLIIVKTVRSGSMTRWEKVLTVLTFIAAKVIGLTTDRYGWNSFTHSLWVDFTR